ncbi:MAG: DUF5990 family protein [Spirosomataceae bacterium]
MTQEIKIRIVLVAPTTGVDFGIQQGKGHGYEVLQRQKAMEEDLVFDLSLSLKTYKEAGPDFAGKIVQGTPFQRFIYMNIGASAGQVNTLWNRRLKIPLSGITWEQIAEHQNNPNTRLELRILGKAKDGGPSCGTYKLKEDWRVRAITEF